METQTKQFVTRETTIGEIVEKYPEAISALESFGIHCLGCHVSPYESLEMGFAGHGLGEAEVEEAVAKLNEVIQNTDGTSTEEASFDGDYDLSLSETAVEKLRVLLRDKKHKALRVLVQAGGCSGFKYVFSLDAGEPEEDDLVVVQDDVHVYVDAKTFEKINGSVLDYEDSLQGAGFVVTNPNAHTTCGCGDSFR